MKREEKNKITFYTIVGLLALFSLFAILGTIKHISRDVNLKKSFRFNGQLFFYSDGDLLGKYKCNSDKCDYATYEDGTKAEIINNKYAFLTDNNKMFLYNITDGKVVLNIVGAQAFYNNIYGIKNENGWGAMLISSNIKNVIEYKYKELSYVNNKFVVLDNNQYKIISGEKTDYISSYKIVDFNSDYVVLSMGGNQVLSDYGGNKYFDTIGANTIKIIDKYFLIKKQSEYYFYDLNKTTGTASYTILGSFSYNGTGEVTYKNSGEVIEFYAENNLLKSIELPSS